jgi:asparagine synthase (glutamine-hydrolysing)
MCGISGIFSDGPVVPELVAKSIDKISHRGPDESGFFQHQNCVLGLCRLSIIDVSSGQQPSYDQSRDVVSVFNGEIYNFRELRQNLISRGHQINGLGDSALIPFLYQEYGEAFPRKLQGMFAIALFDSKRKRLLLVRDRLGKKPLWYGRKEGTLYFSSEIKGLLSLGVNHKLDESVIPEFLSFGYINAPRSAIAEAKQLPPASILSLENGQLKLEQYWSPSEIQAASISFEDAKNETTRLLRESVKTRLVSERPIGAFLSGGIDSTIVTALMQEESESSVHTYSIGFSDTKFDESRFAKEVAKAIGTIHHERVVEADPHLIVETLSKVLDQPFADSSIIPTFLLSKFAREEVVVALSGDGGDEGFAGYERYRAGRFLDSINPLLAINPLRFLPANRISNQRLRKLLRHSSLQSLPNRYRGFQSLFQLSDLHSILNPDLLKSSQSDDFMNLWNSIPTKDRIRKMQEMDLKTYLPGDLMYKVDMASMANSLEVRSPFLDYRVVEFGLSLPAKYKVAGGENKHILREIARGFVPPKLINRPKMGFGIPRARWLRDELKGVVQDVLLDERSRSRGWYQFDKVDEIVNLHNKGLELDSLIWPMLMLEIWAKNWIDSEV